MFNIRQMSMEFFQIALCGVVEADLEHFCNCWSAGFFGERLYTLNCCETAATAAATTVRLLCETETNVVVFLYPTDQTPSAVHRRRVYKCN